MFDEKLINIKNSLHNLITSWLSHKSNDTFNQNNNNIYIKYLFREFGHELRRKHFSTGPKKVLNFIKKKVLTIVKICCKKAKVSQS
jgi:hypothetical protein